MLLRCNYKTTFPSIYPFKYNLRYPLLLDENSDISYIKNIFFSNKIFDPALNDFGHSNVHFHIGNIFRSPYSCYFSSGQGPGFGRSHSSESRAFFTFASCNPSTQCPFVSIVIISHSKWRGRAEIREQEISDYWYHCSDLPAELCWPGKSLNLMILPLLKHSYGPVLGDSLRYIFLDVGKSVSAL